MEVVRKGRIGAFIMVRLENIGKSFGETLETFTKGSTSASVSTFDAGAGRNPYSLLCLTKILRHLAM